MKRQHYTQHGQQRLQQRGFKKEDVDTILRYGTRLHDSQARLFFLTKTDVHQAIASMKKIMDQLQRLKGSAVVLGDKDEVITLYHASKKSQKHLMRRPCLNAQ